MRRRIKDIIEVAECTSLDTLIERLQTFRSSLPEDSCPEVAIRGDDFFGHTLTITYVREPTAEEAALDHRYLAPGWQGVREQVSHRPSAG